METINGLRALKASRVTSAKAPKSFASLRSCPTCGTRLSRYNPDSHCYVHSLTARAVNFEQTGRRGKPRRIDRAEIADLFAQGYSPAQIARYVGAARSSIGRIIREPDFGNETGPM